MITQTVARARASTSLLSILTAAAALTLSTAVAPAALRAAPLAPASAPAPQRAADVDMPWAAMSTGDGEDMAQRATNWMGVELLTGVLAVSAGALVVMARRARRPIDPALEPEAVWWK